MAKVTPPIEHKTKLHDYPNRYICSVLEEMRKANKFRNYSQLGSLIEEAQTMANRMEAAIEDKNDLDSYRMDISKLKKEYAEIVEKYNKVADKLNRKMNVR